MKILPSLFLEFFKIGLFTFGGGYAMLVINIFALHVSSLVIMLAGAIAGLICYAVHERTRKEPAPK